MDHNRQTLDQYREQIIEVASKPPQVLKLAHLIPPIFSISRSLVDDEDPDAIKLPPLVFSKNLKKMKALARKLPFEFAPKREVCFHFISFHFISFHSLFFFFFFGLFYDYYFYYFIILILLVPILLICFFRRLWERNLSPSSMR
jgi:hypothetical protein